MNLRKKPEILAPAGNFEKLLSAIRYGADAVYLAGQRFGLRAAGKNFSDEELTAAASYAHAHAVKAYVTINATARDEELEAIAAYGQKLLEDGFDAAIVADPGVFSCLRDAVPDLELHISTQANVSNASACRFWHKLGAKRIVLSRELSLEQIKQIRKAIPDELELECFVHGAICLAHSGRCLLSSYFNDRSGNRGACTQPCRWEYRLQEIGRGETNPLKLETDVEGTYLLSSKDLCMIEHVPELVASGINSFKIEGRNKGLYYAAVSSKCYRYALDHVWDKPEEALPKWVKEELNLLVHRPYSTGFYFNDPRDEAQLALHQAYLRPASVLAIALNPREMTRGSYEAKEDEYPMKQMNKLSLNEEVAVFSPERGGGQIFTITELKDMDGQPLVATPHPGQAFYVKSPYPISNGSFLRSIAL